MIIHMRLLRDPVSRKGFFSLDYNFSILLRTTYILLNKRHHFYFYQFHQRTAFNAAGGAYIRSLRSWVWDNERAPGCHRREYMCFETMGCSDNSR